MAAAFVSADEIIENARMIAAATDLPTNGDLENCGADEPAEAAKLIPRASEAGLAGGSIEDFTGDRANPIYGFNLAVERVYAAVEAAKKLPIPFVLARAEQLIHGSTDLDATIRRLQAFEQPGADVLYAPGLRTLDQIRTVVSSVGKPVNVVMNYADPSLTLEQLTEAGVKRISCRTAWAENKPQTLGHHSNSFRCRRIDLAAVSAEEGPCRQTAWRIGARSDYFGRRGTDGVAFLRWSAVRTRGISVYRPHTLYVTTLAAVVLGEAFTAAKRIGLLLIVTGVLAAAIAAVASLITYVPVYTIIFGTGLFNAPWRDIALQAFVQGLLTAVISLMLYGRAVSILSASNGSAFAALAPVMTAILATPILGEWPVTRDWIAMLLISGGVYIASGGLLPVRRFGRTFSFGVRKP